MLALTSHTIINVLLSKAINKLYMLTRAVDVSAKTEQTKSFTFP